MDRERAREFLDQVTGWAAGFTTIGVLALADRTGLLAAMAGGDPATVEDLTERAVVHPRYAQELLGALTAAGAVEFDAVTKSYVLPAEHAAVVADATSPYSLAGYLDLLPAAAAQIPALVPAARAGGGIPFSAYGESAVAGIDRANSPGARVLLTRRWLAAMPDVVEKLNRGARIADIGCGSGTAAIVMGTSFPSSEVVGLDVDEASIARATERALREGVENVSFVAGDAAALRTAPGLDLVTAFDVVHDLAAPLATLRAVGEALADDGVLLMMEPRVSADLEDDAGNIHATLAYGISALFCLPQSLAQGGAGLGAAWGPRRAEALVTEAGFSRFEVLPIESPFSLFYRVDR